jgi:hypothetical protein
MSRVEFIRLIIFKECRMYKYLVMLLVVSNVCIADQIEKSDNKGVADGVIRIIRDIAVNAVGGAIANSISHGTDRPTPHSDRAEPADHSPSHQGSDPSPVRCPGAGH